MSTNKSLGHNKIVQWQFQESRQQLNLTQAALAPLLGVSLKSIKNYEQGIRTPPESVLMLLKLELEKPTS